MKLKQLMKCCHNPTPSSATTSTPNTTGTMPKFIQICARCGQRVGKGISHNCNIKNKAQNIDQLLDPRSREELAANVVREKFSETPKGEKSVPLVTASGKNLQIPVPSTSRHSTALHKDSQITTADVKKLMIKDNMPMNAVKKNLQFYRAMKGRNSFEPNILDNLRTELKTLEPFFTLKYFQFEE